EDDRKFTIDEFSEMAGVDKEQSKKILSFVNSKSNSHSAWLTFMYPRLYVAKRLLKDDGVIFISIDDNEVAQLKILMDEIFGEENFVGNISWESKTKTQNTKDSYNKLQPKIEYILLYTKKDQRRFNLIQKGKKVYSQNDDKGIYREYPLEVMNATGIRGRETMIFEIMGILPPDGKQWQFGKEKISEFDKRGDLLLRDGKIIIKMRPEDEKEEVTEPFWGLLFKEIGTAESAKKELSAILENDRHGFETVKPTNLIKRLIFHATHNEDIIMDFFAGSGTTGEAVFQLNAQAEEIDTEGKRKFILVQLPERVDPQKNRTTFDFIKKELKVDEPTIFEITKERLIRATKKIQKDLSLRKDLFTNADSFDLGFKIFETVPIWEDFILNAKEFSKDRQLFDESKLSDSDLGMLLTTWKTYDNILLTENLEQVDFDDYTGQYGKGKLYLIYKGFETKNLKVLLEKIDSNPDFNPVTVIAFGYNFESKTLRELSESLEAYSNKKQLDIDFLIRY
ncbi:MAG: site-specific DNA-methyltransferase, partial [Bacteroidia bacterium]|nr:site-specific DNA-methyltransferase [Bacteroidia bacterium]